MRSSDLVVGNDYLVNRHRDWRASREFSRRRVLAVFGWAETQHGPAGLYSISGPEQGYQALRVIGPVSKAAHGRGYPLLARVTVDGELVVRDGAVEVEVVHPEAIRGPWAETVESVRENIRTNQARLEGSIVSNRLVDVRLDKAVSQINALLPLGTDSAKAAPDHYHVLVPLGAAEWLAQQLDALAVRGPGT